MKNLLLFAFILFLTGCAKNHGDMSQCLTTTYRCGFWEGLVHGFVLPVSWFGSLLDKDIAVFAVNNDGGWYVFGFAVGSGAFGSLMRMIFGKSK